MRFYAFHLMPWPYLPDDFAATHDTAWVVCENELYDPQRGHEVYNRYLDELELADQLGFDGICVNEHHQNAYGLMPSPNIMAACLARRTSHAKLVILGNVLTLYDHPLRVAEEIAMLDVVSGGRVVSGQVVGTGNEFFSYNINPTYARERFREAHELIIKAWTEPGPFAWEGEHYQFRYVNVWPKPFQQPHPPIWIPGSGSQETIDWVAERRFTYMVLPTLAPYAVRAQTADKFREACERAGYTARHDQIGWGIGIYVAQTDAQAVAEYEPHFWYYAKNLLKNRDTFNAPPGHSSISSLLGTLERRRNGRPGNFSTWEEIQKAGYVVVGSPATVRDRLREIALATGLGTLVPNFSVGNVPHQLTRTSMNLFAHEVMPSLRDINVDSDEVAAARRCVSADLDQLVQVGARPTRMLTAGTGPPIVWLHDTLGNRWTAGHEQLRTACTVMAPSLPGVEDSTTLDGIDAAEDVVFWLLDLLAEMRLDRPVLLGCGLGGWMAAEFAVRYPERLGRLVLVDAYGLRVNGELAADEFALTPPMLRPLLFAAPDGDLATEILPNAEAPERIEFALHARVAAARLAWQFPYDRKLRARLGRVTVPSLVVWGEQDRLVSVAHGHAYAAGLPDARLVVVPGAGHYPYLEQPAAFAEAVTTFIRK